MKDILILVTGGTIDKVHDTQTEALSFAPDRTSQIPNILDQGRCYVLPIKSVLMKDSLEFDDTDRQHICDAIQTAPEHAIVVTHGTGTLGDSARFVARHNTTKTVIFTGAMRPYSLGKSDASFNLGGAIIAAQILPIGIYGVMNGRIFDADKLYKNTDLGRFDV